MIYAYMSYVFVWLRLEIHAFAMLVPWLEPSFYLVQPKGERPRGTRSIFLYMSMALGYKTCGDNPVCSACSAGLVYSLLSRYGVEAT